MAKLKLMFKGEVLDVYSLDREQLTVGRRPDNDVQIDNLAVSGRHARILTIVNDSFIQDLDSTNGTYVNGDRVTKQALHDGDVITIGKHQLTYDAEQQAEPDDFERTMVIGTSSKAARTRSDDSHPENSQPPGVSEDILQESKQAHEQAPAPAKLRVLSGRNRGKEMSLTKKLTTLGKPGTQVVAITRRPDGYYIVHIEGDSATPPKLNGKAIGHNATPMAFDDVIEVAGVTMDLVENTD